jgi:hypothetical protein
MTAGFKKLAEFSDSRWNRRVRILHFGQFPPVSVDFAENSAKIRGKNRVRFSPAADFWNTGWRSLGAACKAFVGIVHHKGTKFVQMPIN